MAIIWPRIGVHRHAAAQWCGFLARAIGAVQSAFVAERDRWALWLPVLLGVGVAAYFALPAEPPLWLGAAVCSLIGAALLVLRRRGTAVLCMVAALAAVFGFARAQLQTALVEAPVLTKRLGPVPVTGRVVRVEPREGAERITLDRVWIARLPAARTPVRVRLRVRQTGGRVVAGDRVRMTAILAPPPAPAAPGTFDFARRAYFERLGGVGFQIGRLRVIERGGGAATELARLRQAATARILGGLDARTGPVAAALMTGERGAIGEAALASMRDSGLAHLLAISGLHIGLVAGILFFGLRLGLAAAGGIALRHPIKKWAAAAAALGAFAYLLISGVTVPTQRAFVMTLVVLLAVMLDRTAISMRLVAWAAAAVLLLAPEALSSASFQMSFAAVLALVAAYETLSPRLAGWRSGAGPGRRLLLYLAGVLLTTVIAGMATAPFAAFHFNRIAVYGLAANLLAIPLTGFWIMPWAVLAFVLMPLGLEELALAPMGWGIEALLAVAEEVASWPGSVRLVPAAPTAALALFVLGGLWLCLWRTRWRLLGLLGIVGAAVVAPLSDPPDLLVEPERRMLAVRGPDGVYAISNGDGGSFGAELWLRRAGQSVVRELPAHGRDAGGRAGCDRLGCIVDLTGTRVAVAYHRAALAEDCREAVLVIAFVALRRRNCPGPARIIQPWDLRRGGAHALWVEDGGLRIETAAEATGMRPWRRAAASPPKR